MKQTKTEKANVHIRIPPELNEKLTKQVAKIGISKAAFILNLVYDALEGKKSSNTLKTQ